MRNRCDFCGKEINQVVSIVSSFKSCICDECIEICNEILEDEGIESGNDCYNDNQDGLIHCTFCGRNQNKVDKLIAGPYEHYICNLCSEYIMRFLNGYLGFTNSSSHEEDNDFYEDIIHEFFEDAVEEKILDTEEYKFFITLCERANCKLTEAAEEKVKIALNKKNDPGTLFSQVRLNQVSRLAERPKIEYEEYSIIEVVDIPNI